MEWVLGLAALLVLIALVSFVVKVLRKPRQYHDAVDGQVMREADVNRAMGATARRTDRR